MIAVTGGAGFIGSHIVDELVRAGFEVRVADLLHPAAHSREPDHLTDGASYEWFDIADSGAVSAFVDGADAVCHQASMVGLGVDFADVRDYVHHNDVATASLLWALHGSAFSGRFVLGSSMVVYGEGSYRCRSHGVVRPGPRSEADLDAGRFEPRCPSCGDDLEPIAVTEDAPTDPRNVYAATKLRQEHLCAAFAREHDVALTVLRYHNVYGPRMPRDTPYAGVAAIFRSALERGEAPQVFEDGRQTRDFVHVTDVACANVLALAESRPGTFNVCSGHPHTVGEMAAALADSFGGPAPVVTGGYRLGDVRHVFASPERARADLGFEAAVRFEDGMRDFARAPLRG